MTALCPSKGLFLYFYRNEHQMNYILFDGFRRANLLPFTFLRPVADIRFGVLTIREKWETFLGQKTSTLTEHYLRSKYPIKEADDNLMINGSVCPNAGLIQEIHALDFGQVLYKGEVIIALRVKAIDLDKLEDEKADDGNLKEFHGNFLKLTNTWDIFSLNGQALEDDFALLTKGRKSAPVSKTNRVIGDRIFLEEGAKVECSILNASTGPIYIGRDAEIMEGCMVRGPFSLGDHATLKMGAKIYGPTTIGPHCKVGGEVNNSVIFGYSNKAHDGFMGNSVIAEWCNIGADSNTSNLKNNYDNVKLWNYADQTFVETGLQFCGLIMGDHSKCGINTMFNTGTVVGVSANIYGSGYHRNFIPGFVWGGVSGYRQYHIDQAVKTAKSVFRRRGMEFDAVEEQIFRDVYQLH